MWIISQMMNRCYLYLLFCVCVSHSFRFAHFFLLVFPIVIHIHEQIIYAIDCVYSILILGWNYQFRWLKLTSHHIPLSLSLSLLFAAISDIDTDIFSLKTNQTPHSTKLIVWDVILMIAQIHCSPLPNTIWLCVSVIFAMFSRFYGYWFCESWARKTIKFH